MSEQHRATHDGSFGGTGGTGAPAGPMLTASDIDAAIDAVAREMTHLEPPSALRVVVVDRIRLLPAPRVSGWWVLAQPRNAWAAAAVLLLLVVATGIWIDRGDVPTPGDRASLSVTPPSPQEPAAGPDPGHATGGFVTTAGRETALLGRSVHLRRDAGRVAATSHVFTDGDDDELVPALAELEPLQFTNIGPEALDFPAVDVAPLSAIPSLDIPSLHSESTDTRSTDPKKEH